MAAKSLEKIGKPLPQVSKNLGSGTLSLRGPIIIPYNPAGQSQPLLTLTCPKISINLLFLIILTCNILPESVPDLKCVYIIKASINLVYNESHKLEWTKDNLFQPFHRALNLKFGNHSLKIDCSTAVLIISSWFPFPLPAAILLFRLILMTSHMTLSSALEIGNG